MAAGIPTRIAVGLGAICTILLLNGLASYYNVTRLVNAEDWVRHTLEVRAALAQLLADVASAETAHRGYAITGEESFVAEYGQAFRAAEEAEKTLRYLTRDNPDQQGRLDTVEFYLRDKTSWMAHVMDARRQRGLDEALADVASGKGAALMERVRAGIGEMATEEDRLLTLRTAEVRTGLRATIGALLIFSVASLLLAILVFYGVRRNVVNREKARAALFSANQMLRLVLDNVPQRIFWKDRDSRFLGGNHQFARDLGYAEPDEIIGKTSADTATAPHAEAYRADDLAVINSGLAKLNYQQPISRRDGTTGWLETSKVPLRDREGNIIGLLGSYQDITERRLAEERLLLQAKAIDASVNGIFITNATKPDHPIEYVNAAAQTISGYSAPEMLGRNCRFLQAGDADQEGRAAIRHALAEQRSTNVVLRNYRKDGTPFWNNLKIAPVRTADGTVTHYVGILDDVTERIRYQEELERQANFDTLTGLPNRALLADRINREIGHVSRSGGFFALAVLDLDQFKLANDGHGHAFGDLLLVEVARRLQAAMRADDTVARYGGDEFVLLINCRGEERFVVVLERVLAAIGDPISIDGQDTFVTCSIGVSTYPQDGADAASLLSHADAAMYRAKEAGRNRFEVFQPEMTQRIRERISVERGLRTALEREELFLHYQPQVDLHTGEICGAEALVRWKHPEEGVISPARFIPIAEDSGLIVPIGTWVLRTACAQCKAWNERTRKPISMSVNLSAIQFRQKGLLDLVTGILRETGLSPEYLELELTESLLMGHADEAVATLDALNGAGLRLAIDDFGTGYSSLSYLKRLPVDKLKIDQSFVRDIPRDPDDMAIARAVISLGHSLDLRVIAEGVETAEQLDFLRQHGCDEVQGYYFSRPVVAGELERLLTDETRR